jgi:hypothetical protein
LGDVADQLNRLWVANDPVATDPTYAGVTYYFTHATRKLGTLQPTFHLGAPLSTVFYNTNTSQLSLVAFNPLTNSQLATLYSNGIPVGSLVLPPGALTTQSQAYTNTVTVVTNLVPARVEQGVAVVWPTVAQSQYIVQAADELSSSPVWTNLGAPMAGDGTTNLLFDPATTNRHRFYRVLQSSP